MKNNDYLDFMYLMAVKNSKKVFRIKSIIISLIVSFTLLLVFSSDFKALLANYNEITSCNLEDYKEIEDIIKHKIISKDGFNLNCLSEDYRLLIQVDNLEKNNGEVCYHVTVVKYANKSINPTIEAEISQDFKVKSMNSNLKSLKEYKIKSIMFYLFIVISIIVSATFALLVVYRIILYLIAVIVLIIKRFSN